MAKKSFTSEKIRLANVRLSFAHLEKPVAFQEGQTKKYQATALLDPSNAEHAKMIAEIKSKAAALCQLAFGTTEGIQVCFGAADKHPKKSKYDGYKGMFFISASNDARPGVANRNGAPVREGEPGCPYNGCYVNFNLTLWAQNNQFGTKVNANLIAVQFVRDGQAFGRGPVNVEDEFEPLPPENGATAAGPVAAGADPW